jgi:hypothetical protein
MSKEAMKQALEALKEGDWYIGHLETIVYSSDDDGIHGNRAKVQEAIKSLEEALSKQKHGSPEDMYVEMYKHLNCPHCGGSGHIDDVAEKQKPYGYLKLSNAKFYHEVEGMVDIDNNPEFLALYTHPYVPTERQPKRAVSTTHKWVGLTDEEIDECDWGQSERDHARAIEAKLKDKNT